MRCVSSVTVFLALSSPLCLVLSQVCRCDLPVCEIPSLPLSILPQEWSEIPQSSSPQQQCTCCVDMSLVPLHPPSEMCLLNQREEKTSAQSPHAQSDGREKKKKKRNFFIPPGNGLVNIYALPIGQGDCTVVQCGNGDYVLADCGSSGSSGMTASDVRDALFKENPAALVTIAISHPDADHMNLLPNIFSTAEDRRHIRSIILSNVRNHPDYSQISSLLNSSDMIGKVFEVSDEGSLCTSNCTNRHLIENACNGVPLIRVLGSNLYPENLIDRENANSLVLRVEFEQFSLMIPGDFELATSTNRLISGWPTGFLETVVYKTAHHGSNNNNANSPTLLNAIKPSLVISSSAYRFAAFNHPRCDVFRRVYEASVDVTIPRYFSVPDHPYSCYDSIGGDITAIELENDCNPIYVTQPTLQQNVLIALEDCKYDRPDFNGETGFRLTLHEIEVDWLNDIVGDEVI